MAFILLCLACFSATASQLQWVGAQSFRTGQPISHNATSESESSFDTGDVGNFSLRCRSNQGLLPPTDLTVHIGNLSCMQHAMACILNTVHACAPRVQTNSEVMKAAHDCSTKYSNRSDAVLSCILPVIAKYCDTTGCSTCQSSISTAFDNKCTSNGGQLCRVTPVLYNHQIQMHSLCAPSVCRAQLLATSLATELNMTVSGQNMSKYAYDNLITCGNGNDSFSVLSSDPNTNVTPTSQLSSTRPPVAETDTVDPGSLLDIPLGSKSILTDFGKLSILCQTSQNALPASKLTANKGNLMCASEAQECIEKTFRSCRDLLKPDSEVGKTIQDCLNKNQDSSGSSSMFTCVLPIMIKSCDTSACSTCPSSISSTFGYNCTSAGGQLCRQKLVVYGHGIQLQSICAQSACSSQLLTTSLAKAYAKHINTELARNGFRAEAFPKDTIDNQITCGSGSNSYSVRSSDPNTPLSPSHASSQTAGVLSPVVAIFSAGAVLRLM